MHECVHAWTDRRTCTCAHACLTHVQRVRHTVGNVTAAQSGPCGRSSAERPTVLARYGPRVVRKCAHDLCTDMDPSRGPMMSRVVRCETEPHVWHNQKQRGKGRFGQQWVQSCMPVPGGQQSESVNPQVPTSNDGNSKLQGMPQPTTAILRCKGMTDVATKQVWPEAATEKTASAVALVLCGATQRRCDVVRCSAAWCAAVLDMHTCPSIPGKMS